MEFFYPDSLDVVDPEFDFRHEENAPERIRHRDDVFAHELLSGPPYDGILMSHSLVYGNGGKQRYRQSQRFRLLQSGAHEFFRTNQGGEPSLKIMGDCGAYSYVDQDVPPVSVDELLDFYGQCRCDYALSVDHVVPGFISKRQETQGRIPSDDWRERQEISLDRARSFLRAHRERGHSSIPIGVAQGWDIDSYTRAVVDLQKMGYRYVALGGLASLSTLDIAATIEEVSKHLKEGVRVHLLGVSRDDLFGKLKDWGVTSFDSAMPTRQAFMDDKHNYHTIEEDYLAIRVPKVSSSPQLQRRVNDGEVSADEAFNFERESLRALRRFDRRETSVDKALEKVRRYEMLFNGRNQVDKYRKTLENRPWENCGCDVCRDIGVEVIMLRGRERNKRRGYHNMRVLYEKVSGTHH